MTMSLIWAAVFGFSSIVWAVCYHSAFLIYQRVGAYMRIALCSLMYRRLLKFDHSAIQRRSKGITLPLVFIILSEVITTFINFH